MVDETDDAVETPRRFKINPQVVHVARALNIDDARKMHRTYAEFYDPDRDCWTELPIRFHKIDFVMFPRVVLMLTCIASVLFGINQSIVLLNWLL